MEGSFSNPQYSPQWRSRHRKLHYPRCHCCSTDLHALCRSCRHRPSLDHRLLHRYRHTLRATYLCGKCSTRTCTAGRGNSIGQRSHHRLQHRNCRIFRSPTRPPSLQLLFFLISSQRILESLLHQYHYRPLCTDGSSDQISLHLFCIFYKQVFRAQPAFL